jgi:iron-sulfur cluster assembly accessory protein
MITISDVAVEKAKEIIDTEGKTGHGLRFFTAGSSCCGPSFDIDIVEKPEDGDDIIEKDGLKLFVGKEASEKLNGMELHFVDDGEKQGFTLTGNQPESSCAPSDSGCSSCG